MQWFLVKVKYTKQLEDGRIKRVTEPYLFSASSFTDAEARAYEEVGEYVRGEFTVVAISVENIHDIFNYEDSDVWYKSTISFVSVDADTGRDKTTKQTIFLNASSVAQATDRVLESLKGLMVDFEIKSVVESPVLGVFPMVTINEEV